MQIDSFTLLVAACAGTLLLGAAFLFFWWQDRLSNWLAWWIAPYLLGGTSIILFMPRGQVSDWISVGAANALLFSAFAMVWQGARVFARRRPSLLPVIAVAMLWLAFCSLPDVFEQLQLRIVIASITTSVLSLLTAWELWRDRDETLPSRSAAVVVMLSFAVLMGLRVPFVGKLPFPVGGGQLDSTWLAALNILIFAHVGAFAFLMVSLTKERREAEQRKFAMLDPLTGMLNRRAFMSTVERAARRRTGRDGEAVALMVLDLDNFKQINDRYGHDVGDRVLVQFAQIAEAMTRPTDQLYRMGGEEFCFILPDTDAEGAQGAAERIRSAFERSSVNARGDAVQATVSIGIAHADHTGFDLELLLEAADTAVYEAKARGRNQIVVAGPSALRRPVIGPVRRTA